MPAGDRRARAQRADDRNRVRGKLPGLQEPGRAFGVKGIAPEVAALHAKGKRVLIVDDLVDTGKTARVVRDLLPDAHFAAVYAKPMGRPMVDTFITEVSQDTWIYFPWDTGLAFQPPIREGGDLAQMKKIWRKPDADTTPFARGRCGACRRCARSASASNYTSQPIHILIGYAAGGGVDIVARLLQEPMKSALGQPIIIENRTGASAMLATGGSRQSTARRLHAAGVCIRRSRDQSFPV